MTLKAKQTKHHVITATCASLLVGSVIAYMYFLSLSVVHVVMRKEISQEISKLRSEIAILETAYIDAHHTISTRVATLQGFSEVSDKIFITANPEQSLVLRTSEE